jgi:ribosome-associated protein
LDLVFLTLPRLAGDPVAPSPDISSGSAAQPGESRLSPFPSLLQTPRGKLWTCSTALEETALPASRSSKTGPKTGKASPKPAATASAPSSPDPLELARLVAAQLDEDKAENILNIPLAGKSPMADAMIVASGRSARHVSALADKVARKLKEAGASKVRVEGLPNADWVLIDAGDLIVHIFRPEVREFYNLERIWSSDA